MPGLAAEMAFYAVLGLFPTLLALAAALGSLDVVVGQDLADRTRDSVVDALEGLLTNDGASTVDAVDQLFRQSSPGLLTFGLLSALWAASRGFGALIRALDVVYDLDELRSWVRVRLIGLGLALGTVGMVAVVLAMVVLGPLLGNGREVADALGFGGAFATLWDWLRWPAVTVVLVAWLATVFHIAPNHRTSWWSDLPGAAATTLLWALLSLGLRAYLALAPGANQVFGVLGGAITVLVWAYLLGLGLLIGAELNAVLVQEGLTPRDPTRRSRRARN